MNCIFCGKEIEKHCSLICQECWDKKHSKLKGKNRITKETPGE